MNCKDENGNNVAWWVAIKFPSGTNYVYADINNAALTLSPYTMANNAVGALSHTLTQIYQANATANATDYAFAFYNDQKPNGSTSSSRGHTKGVVGLTQSGGFWLVHSVPQFPNYLANGPYPGYDAATTYGQSFLCMTLSFDQFTDVGTQFQYNYPWYYDWNVPSWVPTTLAQAISTSKHTTAAASNIVKLSSGGFQFISFAKTSQWNNYLYEDLVAPTLLSDLNCETWMNGANPDPTTCKNATMAYDVINVRNLSISGVSWKETQDHSKWCTSTHNNDQYLCIGDINRMVSQNSRGGGTVCFITKLWTSFNNMITGADSCPSFYSTA